jgi:SAM-dependent methyltransferase
MEPFVPDIRRDILESDRRHHDEVAPMYDAWFVEPLQYRLLHAELVEMIVRVFDKDDGPLIEFGAGTGAIAAPLGDMGYDVLAVDASEGMLARLAEKCPRVRRLQADVSRPLPLQAGSAGCVVISQALHHMPDQRAVLAEIHRLLRRGGVACIFEPQLLPGPLDLLRRAARRLCCPGQHVTSEAPIHPRRLRRELVSMGLAPLRCKTTFFFPFNPRWRPCRWLIRMLWTLPGKLPLVRRLGGVFMITARKN